MLKRAARRLRAFMQADVMAELAALRGEMMRRDELSPMMAQIENALLSLALARDDTRDPDDETVAQIGSHPG
ncbi:MAG: hypothetical protein POH28_01095 [Acidocella sp.]|nr:hypothetical protein [Acidocella sp.]